MTNYSHLSQEQRYQIEALLNAKKSASEVADILGCHRSSIYREIKRNRSRYGYSAMKAQEKTTRRHTCKPKRRRFTKAMKKLVVRLLTVPKYSPELISAAARKDDPGFVSHETIYKWIWEMKFNYEQRNREFKKLYQCLRHGRDRMKRGSFKNKRGIITDRVSIEKRPRIVEKRTRLGDFEIDLMLGKNRLPGLLVATERATLKTFLSKINSRYSSSIADTIIRKLGPVRALVRTMTYDNDISFAEHLRVNKALQTKSYFTHPYSAQEKGTVENRIGVLRRFFPKKTDFSDVSIQRIKRVESLLNDRPVRKFKYQSPNAVFLRKSVALNT
jgi:IS30 family transposase